MGSVTGEQLFARGFGKMLNQGFTELLPVLLTLVLSSLVAYTLYNSYKKTLRDLDVNHNFVNVDRTHSLHIALHHLVAYTASFTLPLLFWCFYLIMWFPAIARKPLSYILSSDVSSFALVSCLVVMFLVLLTQLGLVITRLAVRILK